VRVHAASGGIYEFHPRKAIDTTWREGEVFLLGREIELTGIELIYRCPADARVLPSLAVHAGVSTLPPYDRACAERLGLARRELAQGKLENAEEHVRRAVALLEQYRRAIAP
jgi:Flp pilus assembly protein TadD